MMLHKLFAIYDVKAEAFMPVIGFVTRGQAVRWFTDIMHDGQQEVAKHPEDYKLFQIGDYDVGTGWVRTCLDKDGDGSVGIGPVFIVSGLDVMSTERGGL